MSLRSLIAALLAIWAFCSNAAAQDALQPKERALLDAYRLQLSLEEASSLVKKSFWDFERRVLLKEKIVLLSCMPHVHTTLVYSIENLSDNCREDIKTLLAAYPGSVVGICALHGLNSQPCRDSYAEMYIDRAPNQPAEGRENEDSGLDYYISRIQKTTQNRSDLKERASKTAQRFRDNRDPKASFDLFMQARQAFFNYLPQACESVHNRILESIPPDAKRVSKLPLPDGIKIQDDLLDEWHKFEEERSKDVAQLREEARRKLEDEKRQKEQKKQKHQDSVFEKTTKSEEELAHRGALYRIRYLEDSCVEAISLAFGFQKDFPLATCYWQGFSSPACISQIALEKSFIIRNQKTDKPVNPNLYKKPDSLATF